MYNQRQKEKRSIAYKKKTNSFKKMFINYMVKKKKKMLTLNFKKITCSW